MTKKTNQNQGVNGILPSSNNTLSMPVVIQKNGRIRVKAISRKKREKLIFGK